MAESMSGLKRSNRCGELNLQNEGQKVTVMGWVQKSRNKGSIIFVDLRDRSGILQIIFEEGKCSDAVFEKAAKLRSEFVIAVVGTVCRRAGAVNKNLATGEIEVVAEQLRILSESETPPFQIEENSKTKEERELQRPGEMKRLRELHPDLSARDPYYHRYLTQDVKEPRFRINLEDTDVK